jgi:hypothetical protein
MNTHRYLPICFLYCATGVDPFSFTQRSIIVRVTPDGLDAFQCPMHQLITASTTLLIHSGVQLSRVVVLSV